MRQASKAGGASNVSHACVGLRHIVMKRTYEKIEGKEVRKVTPFRLSCSRRSSGSSAGTPRDMHFCIIIISDLDLPCLRNVCLFIGAPASCPRSRPLFETSVFQRAGGVTSTRRRGRGARGGRWPWAKAETEPPAPRRVKQPRCRSRSSSSSRRAPSCG